MTVAQMGCYSSQAAAKGDSMEFIPKLVQAASLMKQASAATSTIYMRQKSTAKPIT